MRIVRILCPASNLSKNERILNIINNFSNWINTDEFKELIYIFGGHYLPQYNTIDQICWLKEEFIDVWDYRKRQREALTKEGEAARWLLKNDNLIDKNRTIIYDAAKILGLIGNRNTIYSNADYILPLGGARMSNLRRCELANQQLQTLQNHTKIVALSGMRPISDSERKGFIDTYAPNATTEYDAICCGMKKAFKNIYGSEDELQENSNPNLSYAIKHFLIKGEQNYEAYALAAPSTDPSRRANSADCFKFFFQKFHVKKHSKIINCTSEIYCPYQQVRSLSFAIDYQVEFDTIGFPFYLNNVVFDENNQQLSEPVNYLQEMKATIDAMYDFIKHYSIK